MEVAIQIEVVTDNNTHQKRTKASGNKLPHPLKIHQLSRGLRKDTDYWNIQYLTMKKLIVFLHFLTDVSRDSNPVK